MITRIWKSWTTPSNAPAYEELLLVEIFSGIAARNIPGYRGISLGKRDVGDEIEFATIMRSEERRVGKECRSRWSPYH